jgi:hypothetical protein
MKWVPLTMISMTCACSLTALHCQSYPVSYDSQEVIVCSGISSDYGSLPGLDTQCMSKLTIKDDGTVTLNQESLADLKLKLVSSPTQSVILSVGQAIKMLDTVVMDSSKTSFGARGNIGYNANLKWAQLVSPISNDFEAYTIPVLITILQTQGNDLSLRSSSYVELKSILDSRMLSSKEAKDVKEAIKGSKAEIDAHEKNLQRDSEAPRPCDEYFWRERKVEFDDPSYDKQNVADSMVTDYKNCLQSDQATTSKLCSYFLAQIDRSRHDSSVDGNSMIWQLQKLGAEARDALPQLEVIAQDKSDPLFQDAKSAVKEIKRAIGKESKHN